MAIFTPDYLSSQYAFIRNNFNIQIISILTDSNA